MPVEFNPGGVDSVHYSADGTDDSWTEINGDVTRAEGLPAEAITQAHTSGDYQSGETLAPTFYFNDHQDFSTVQAFCVGANRVKKWIAVVFKNGRILRTTKAVYLKCLLVPKAVRSEGDSEWSLGFNDSDDAMWEAHDSLTS